MEQNAEAVQSDLREISLAELAEHSNRESLWVSIEDYIYDLTEFVKEHPGGDEVILREAGKNATGPFVDIGHSQDARELMLNYRIGILPEHERDHDRKHKEWLDRFESSPMRWIFPVAFGLVFGILYKTFVQPI